MRRRFPRASVLVTLACLAALFAPAMAAPSIQQAGVLPFAHAVGAIGVRDDFVYLVGGVLAVPGGNSITDRVVRVDLATGVSSELEQPLPTGVFLAAGGSDGRFVYAFGGLKSPGVTNEIQRFDMETGSSVRLPSVLPIPDIYTAPAVPHEGAFLLFGIVNDRVLRFDPVTGAVEVDSDEPIPVVLGTAVAVGGRVFVYGGCLRADGCVPTDPKNKIWEYADGRFIQQAALLPEPLGYSTAVALGGDVYIFAGALTNGPPFTDTIVRHRPATGEIEVLEARLPQAFVWPTTTAHGGRIFIVGGVEEGSVLRDEILVFDAEYEEWLGVSEDLHGEDLGLGSTQVKGAPDERDSRSYAVSGTLVGRDVPELSVFTNGALSQAFASPLIPANAKAEASVGSYGAGRTVCLARLAGECAAASPIDPGNGAESDEGRAWIEAAFVAGSWSARESAGVPVLGQFLP